MRSAGAEFAGTLAIVFVGCGAIAIGASSALVATVFGAIVAVMIGTVGQLSGAHFNPAVTVGLAAHGSFPWTRVGGYVVAQIAGALVAALALRLLGPTVDLGVTRPGGSAVQAIVWEAVLTFALVVVILAVSTGDRASRWLPPIAIGATITVGALVGGPISGAAMNPARSIGPAVVSRELADLWIYILGPLVGAIAAAVSYEAVRARAAIRS